MGRPRIYEVKENYFEKWDHKMAYILGFISADGSVNSRSLSIELATKDREILEFIQKQIAPDVPIKLTKKKKKQYNRLRICSTKLVQSLLQYSVVPNKTHIMKLDFDVPSQYFGDYLRGLFDGDGWVYCRRNTIESGIVSYSKEYLKALQKLLPIGRIQEKHKTTKAGKYCTWYTWEMDKEDSLKLRDTMYQSDTVFALTRKQNKLFSDFYTPSSRWWTPEQIQYLKNHYGEPLQTVADAIGKSYKAVSKKIWELKFTSI